MADDARLHAPATERNRESILAVLRQLLPKRGLVLEIASGSGEHACFFARAMPDLTWQPSDSDSASRASIEAHREDAGLSNLRAPLALDVTSNNWPIAEADAIFCANMIHISPWETTLGLAKGAGRILRSGGGLCLYGPFMRDGKHTAPSNANFDEWLRDRDPRWGIRDLAVLARVFEAEGLSVQEAIEMPANNLSLWVKKA